MTLLTIQVRLTIQQFSYLQQSPFLYTSVINDSLQSAGMEPDCSDLLNLFVSGATITSAVPCNSLELIPPGSVAVIGFSSGSCLSIPLQHEGFSLSWGRTTEVKFHSLLVV